MYPNTTFRAAASGRCSFVIVSSSFGSVSSAPGGFGEGMAHNLPFDERWPACLAPAAGAEIVSEMTTDREEDAGQSGSNRGDRVEEGAPQAARPCDLLTSIALFSTANL